MTLDSNDDRIPEDVAIDILTLDECVDKQYKVKKLLGQGAFGAVYLVETSAGRSFALKSENMSAKVRVLKMEVIVLKTLTASKATHFCQIIDTGRWKSFFYLVMTLVGESLASLRKSFKNSRFTTGCAISCSIQCLEAVQELHNVGYLHRDLKPANFAVSMSDQRRIILLDFGMARKYIEGNSILRKPRASAGFRGTLRYASVRCKSSQKRRNLLGHKWFELSRKDDLESWIYQTIELTSGTLPWSHLADINKVMDLKLTSRDKEHKLTLCSSCPKEYLYILDYVDSLEYYEDPKYSILRGLLREALKINKLKEFPYDWEK